MQNFSPSKELLQRPEDKEEINKDNSVYAGKLPTLEKDNKKTEKCGLMRMRSKKALTNRG